MSAQNPQVVDSQEFIDILDYSFTGDNATVERKRALIEAFREHGTIFHAAAAIRVHRKTVYRWIDTDPEFAEALEDSKEDCYDKVETSVYKKAVNGGTLESFFYLKAHRPKFRDKVSIDLDSVVSEIRDRLSSLNVKQLPVTNTSFIPVAQASEFQPFSPEPQPVNAERFRDQPAQSQKEDSSALQHNPDIDS